MKMASVRVLVAVSSRLRDVHVAGGRHSGPVGTGQWNPSVSVVKEEKRLAMTWTDRVSLSVRPEAGADGGRCIVALAAMATRGQ